MKRTCIYILQNNTQYVLSSYKIFVTNIANESFSLSSLNDLYTQTGITYHILSIGRFTKIEDTKLTVTILRKWTLRNNICIAEIFN